MSADNWARCPRCTRVGQAKLDKRGAAVYAKYGQVPIKEFDEARVQHAKAVADFEQREATFREDYEIYGAADGVITVEYSGSCSKCGLALKFTDVHPIPGLEADGRG